MKFDLRKTKVASRTVKMGVERLLTLRIFQFVGSCKFEVVWSLIVRLFEYDLANLRLVPVQDNIKGKLQEFLQSQLIKSVRYGQESIIDFDHDHSYDCSVGQN